MEKSLKELKKEFEIFLQEIPNSLNQIKEFNDLEELTFSFEEIENIKLFYELNYKNPNKLNLTYDKLCNIFYAYLGEAFIFHLGGEWALGTTKSDKAYGTPTIIKWGGMDYPWSRISPMIWKRRLEKGILGPASLLFHKREPF